MDEFTLTFDDNRQSLSVASTASLAQLSSQFEDLHLGNDGSNLLNGLISSNGIGHHHHHHHHHHHNPLNLSGSGALERHLNGNSSNVIDTFVAVVNGLTSKVEERPVKYKSHTECVPVPSSEHVAEIVGRQGCKIKALRAKTNTFIKTPIRGEEPIFVITGTKEDVTRAKQEILSAADHFSMLRSSKKQAMAMLAESRNMLGYSTPDEITIQIRVPQKVVGLVVGPKGATIKNIQLKTNTYIITPKRNQESVFEITGLPANVHMARQLIEEHIATRAGTTATSTNTGGSTISSGHNSNHGNSVSGVGSATGSGASGCLGNGNTNLLNGSAGAGVVNSSNTVGNAFGGCIANGNIMGNSGVPNGSNEVIGLGSNSAGGLIGGSDQDFETNQFIIDNLLEYINNVSISSAFNSPTTENAPDFRNIWENLSESQGSGATTDTENSSLVWTLPSSSRNSMSYSPDDFIFQR